MNEKPRADELVVLVVVPQDVAHVLAQEALDALAEFLNAIGIFLSHSPGPVRSVGLSRLKRLDPHLHLVVPRHVRHQILDARERLHRLDDDGGIGGQVVEARHAHEFGHAVDLGGTRPALSGLAVPPAREVRRLRRLDLMNGIKDDHPLAHLGGVVLELTGGVVASPDTECGMGHWFVNLVCSRVELGARRFTAECRERPMCVYRNTVPFVRRHRCQHRDVLTQQLTRKREIQYDAVI